MKVEKLVSQQFPKRKAAWSDYEDVLEYRELFRTQITALADTSAVMKTECHRMRQ